MSGVSCFDAHLVDTLQCTTYWKTWCSMQCRMLYFTTTSFILVWAFSWTVKLLILSQNEVFQSDFTDCCRTSCAMHMPVQLANRCLCTTLTFYSTFSRGFLSSLPETIKQCPSLVHTYKWLTILRALWSRDISPQGVGPIRTDGWSAWWNAIWSGPFAKVLRFCVSELCILFDFASYNSGWPRADTK